jgi:SAM-dependent methyltransferase
MKLKQEKCEICNSKNIAKNFTYQDRHYLTVDNNFDVWKCNDCSLFFLNPMPTTEELTSYYPKSYYSYGKNILKNSAWRLWLHELLKLDPSDLTNIPNSCNEKILDFGCGSGWSLNLYKEKGFVTHGLDLDKAAIIEAELNGHIMSGVDLLTTKYSHNFFDLIRSNHSLEHINNPVETVKEFNRILKNKGRLFIAVPNTDSLTRMIFGKFWYYTGVPYHTFNYSLDNLKILLESGGFTIQKVVYRSSWQGIFGSLALFLNRNSSKKSLDSFFVSRIFRVTGVFLSKILDLVKRGDSIEIYAVKK